MKKLASHSLDVLTWQDIRHTVQLIQPTLAALIDEINPGADYPLFKISYPFGASIVEKGRLSLSQSVMSTCPSYLAKELAFLQAHPLALVLNRSVEMFRHSQPERFSGHQVYQAGDLLFLSQFFEVQGTDPASQYLHMTAGARSLFMLPPVSDKVYFSRLKLEFDLPYIPPQTIWEQWPILVAITNHPAFPLPWHTELLFFSAAWITALQEKTSWAKLRLYLLEQAWQQSAYWRNKGMLDSLFSQMISNQNLRPDPYLLDTVKHLFSIALGAASGFAPAGRDNRVGPISVLQDIYVQVYQLKQYEPLMLCAQSFTGKSPVYYSLNNPTSLEFSPQNRQLSRTIEDLRDLRHIALRTLKEIQRLPLTHTRLGSLPEQVQFDYFHSKPDSFGEIQPTTRMAQEDNSLTLDHIDYGARTFAYNGDFVRGCVRIAPTKKFEECKMPYQNKAA